VQENAHHEELEASFLEHIGAISTLPAC
jgi:hypothetical protein